MEGHGKVEIMKNSDYVLRLWIALGEGGQSLEREESLDLFVSILAFFGPNCPNHV